MDTKDRIRLEKRIILDLVAALHCAGFAVGYHDGEELAVKPGIATYGEIAENLHSTDEARLVIRRPDDMDLRWGVLLVYGNSPWEVFCDWSDDDYLTDLIMGLTDALYDELN